MWLPEMKWSIFVVFLLSGCFFGKSNAVYDKLMSLPEGDRCAYFHALTTDQRIGLYLYGVNSFRPSDFTLGDCFTEIDPELAGALIARLSESKDERTAFALILALHGVTKSNYPYVVPAGFKAEEYCRQESACLKLAYEIDRRFGLKYPSP